MRRFLSMALLLALAVNVQAAKLIPNGSNSQSIEVVIRDAAGAPVTGITIANLDLYCKRDGAHPISAKVDLVALATTATAWTSGRAIETGYGMYRIDIPDANMSDGVGTMLTYIIDDAVGANVTSFYEVQLKDPWQTGDAYAIVNHGTYGNSALETLVDGVESELANATYGLAALETLVDGIESELASGTYGLAALKAYVDTVETSLSTITTNTTNVVSRYRGN